MSFSFADHTVKITPTRGTIRSDYRLLSGNKIAIDPGAGADHMPGMGELPYAIVQKANKPKFSLEGIAADEVGLVREHVGGIGGNPFAVMIIVQRPGIEMVRWKIVGCTIGEGGGWGADDNGATDKIGGPCLNLLYSRGSNPFRSIFKKRGSR